MCFKFLRSDFLLLFFRCIFQRRFLRTDFYATDGSSLCCTNSYDWLYISDYQFSCYFANQPPLQLQKRCMNSLVFIRHPVFQCINGQNTSSLVPVTDAISREHISALSVKRNFSHIQSYVLFVIKRVKTLKLVALADLKGQISLMGLQSDFPTKHFSKNSSLSSSFITRVILLDFQQKGVLY